MRCLDTFSNNLRRKTIGNGGHNMGVLTTHEFRRDVLESKEHYKLEPKDRETEQPTEELKEQVNILKKEDEERSE